MRISIANKTLNAKPQTSVEKGKYFKGLQFKTGNFNLSTFRKIVENGCTITYTYNDDVFDRGNHYMTNNYKGTDFIIVDVDKCDKDPATFIQGLRYQPTFVHTTFSNLTEQKDNLYCFHLVYCFDRMIDGEHNFHRVFDTLTADYSDFVDSAAKDCHRVMFTSNGNLPNFEFLSTDKVYKVDDFIDSNDCFDTLEDFLNVNPVVAKSESAYIFTSNNNMKADEKIATNKKTEAKNVNNFNLDPDFFSDLNSLSRSEFLSTYLPQYPIISCTQPTNIQTTANGIQYADLRNVDYYEVPSKYRYNAEKGKMQVNKVGIGKRSNTLMYDCYCYIKCNPDITKEWLVTELVNEVYRNYDNSDGELNNKKIVSVAEYGWNNINNVEIKPKNKKFKILFSESMTKKQAVGQLNKIMKDNEIGGLLDLDGTFETNIKIFKENGLNVTKQRLQQFCNDYGIELLTDKQARNNKIFSLYKENQGKTLRELEQICKDNGININYSSLSRILRKI